MSNNVTYKTLAVISSILLVTGFILFTTGALRQSDEEAGQEQDVQPVASSPQDNASQTAGGGTTAATQDDSLEPIELDESTDIAVMAGSKSMILVEPMELRLLEEGEEEGKEDTGQEEENN